VRDDTAVSCATIAEQIKIPFGLWSHEPRDTCVTWGAHCRNLANTIEPSMFGWAEWRGGDAALCKLLWPCGSSMACRHRFI